MKSLIVDDNNISRKLLVSILNIYGVCDQASSGLEALDMIQESYGQGSPYQLVCLDVMMPGMDGIELLEAIQDLEKSKGLSAEQKVKVMMASSLEDEKSKFRALQGGCEFYVTKPIEKNKVIEVLEAQGLI
jgi:two-component system, chemotaxis family, chemotaxis protein CheY